MARLARPENNSVLGVAQRASTTTRQPPLVNRRSSVNRLVNRQPVDAGERFASDCVIRQSGFAFRDSPRNSLKIAAFGGQFASLAAPETGDSEPKSEDFGVLSLFRISLVP